MSSHTLDLIMKHWVDDFLDDSGFSTLPFNIERACRDNDAEIQRLTALVTKYEAAIDEHKHNKTFITEHDHKLWQTRGK